MGILLVYDVTDEASFNNIRNWMRNIEQHASDNVNKVRGCVCVSVWVGGWGARWLDGWVVGCALVAQRKPRGRHI